MWAALASEPPAVTIAGTSLSRQRTHGDPDAVAAFQQPHHAMSPDKTDPAVTNINSSLTSALPYYLLDPGGRFRRYPDPAESSTARARKGRVEMLTKAD